MLAIEVSFSTLEGVVMKKQIIMVSLALLCSAGLNAMDNKAPSVDNLLELHASTLGRVTHLSGERSDILYSSDNVTTTTEELLSLFSSLAMRNFSKTQDAVSFPNYEDETKAHTMSFSKLSRILYDVQNTEESYSFPMSKWGIKNAKPQEQRDLSESTVILKAFLEGFKLGRECTDSTKDHLAATKALLELLSDNSSN